MKRNLTRADVPSPLERPEGDAQPAGHRVLAGPGTITAISGLTFAISDELGDIGPAAQGLIAHDTRHLSRLAVRVNGEPLRHLGAGLIEPEAARFRGYPALLDGGPDAVVEADRLRRVGPHGLDEEITLRSWSAEEVELDLEVTVDCDFADIFEVRRVWSGAAARRRRVSRSPARGEVIFSDPPLSTTIRFSPVPDRLEDGRASWRLTLARRESWTLRISVRATAEPEVEAEPILGTMPRPATPSTAVATDPPDLAHAARIALFDLAALSVRDDLDPCRRLVAAGIPWFVALFGRDSLITSHQARAFEPGLALATLRALAARQGMVVDPGNEEEPGKILHEVRLTRRPWLGEGTAAGARPYYGSIDATPLFLVLLGTAWRWGAAREEIESLLPAARAALGWIRSYGDPDGDGLLEYRPHGPRSLANQAWKDSENAVQFPDGALAHPPIAVAEVQGYAYLARHELARVLAWLGHDEEASDLMDEAARQRELIRSTYWVPGEGGRPGYFALALDGEKRRVDSVASNMGHLLWCGVPSEDEARQVAERLLAPDMASGWGLRTLSSEMAGFNPISYHVGSVWPHDTAIACEGMRRYGLDDPALRLASDLIDAMRSFDHRLPELFTGHARTEADFPVPYPTACRPQAWAAGVALTFVPMLLGLAPRIPEGAISLSPALPPGMRSLEVTGIPFPSGPLSVAVADDGNRVIEAPPGVAIEFRARPAAGG